MTMYADKSQNNGKQSTANEAISKNDSLEQSSLFTDNRPVAFAQRKVKQAMNLHTTRQNPVIQRLTGMEVELGIPFYKTIPERIDAFKKNESSLSPIDRKDMGSFLWGGLEYGKSYGEIDEKYDISADHNSFQRAHAEFVNYLTTHGYVTFCDYPTMTNLEYRTKPFEERDPDSQLRFVSMAGLIQTHANDAVTKAKSSFLRNLLQPVEDKHTGIPYFSFRRLLQGDDAGLTALQNVRTAIDPKVYYQTTTGVLPSEVPGLFRQAALDIARTRPAPKSRPNISKEILENSVRMADETMQDRSVVLFLSRFTEGERRSLCGWLTLISQYLLANSVDTTEYTFEPTGDRSGRVKHIGGTSKNTVPYLSKTWLESTVEALPSSIRPDRSVQGWVDLLNVLLRKLATPAYSIIRKLSLTDHVGKRKVGGGTVGHETIGDLPHVWLKDLVDGLAIEHTMTGNVLSLDSGQEVPLPELTIPEEEAIPLEDRKSQSKMSFGDPHDTGKIGEVLLREWEKAKDRRIASTEKYTQYQEKYARIKALVSSVDRLSPRINDLRDWLPQFNRDILVAPYDVWYADIQLSKYEVRLHAGLVHTFGIIYRLVEDNSDNLNKLTLPLGIVYTAFTRDLNAVNIGRGASDSQIVRSLEQLIVLFDKIEDEIPSICNRFRKEIKDQFRGIILDIESTHRDDDVFKILEVKYISKIRSYNNVKVKTPSLDVLEEWNALYLQLRNLWREVRALLFAIH